MNPRSYTNIMNKTGASGNQDSVIYTSAAGVKENDIADWLGFGSASRQRAYDYHMATHGYQYAVEDMKKAGLNPAAMYGGVEPATSSSAGGASASSGKGWNAILSIASLFSNTAKVMKQVNDIKTDRQLAQNAMEMSKRMGFK